MARLLDVARAAGVSRSTVSNVFNNPERVRPALRERVLTAARDLAYGGPDPRGRLLRAGKVDAIGVVFMNNLTHLFEGAYMRVFMSGVSSACDEAGAGLALAPALDVEAAARTIRNALVDGLILHCPQETATLVAAAVNRRLPVVAVDFDAGPDVASVRTDFRAAARLAMEHLLELGHRRFAILSLPLKVDWARGGAVAFSTRLADRDRRVTATHAVAREHILGWSDALAAAALSIDAVPIVESLIDPEGVAEGAAFVLDAAAEATAILTMSDPQAIAVIDEARRRGIAVPHDLSVVGFDGTPEAATATPPLTTVAEPIRDKGRLAATALLEDLPPRQLVMPVELVVRGSTAPAKH